MFTEKYGTSNGKGHGSRELSGDVSSLRASMSVSDYLGVNAEDNALAEDDGLAASNVTMLLRFPEKLQCWSIRQLSYTRWATKKHS